MLQQYNPIVKCKMAALESSGLDRAARAMSVESIADLPLEDATREKLEGSRELNVVVVGCYQVGKSTLINSLFFERGKTYIERAEEGMMDPCTQDVNPHVLIVQGISYKIYDSPGLQDGSKAGDLVYLWKIKHKCPKIHLVIYCTKMEEPVRPTEYTALSNLTSTFGDTIWQNTVIALTFANRIDSADPEADEGEHFQDVQRQKERQLRNAFDKLSVRKEVIDNLFQRVYPTGSARKLSLPSGVQDWRVDFWYGCLDACQPEGKGALLKLAWRNRQFVMKVIGASVATTSGGLATVGGLGCVAAGAALTASGILAPVGVPLIAAGAVATLLGLGTAFNNASSIKSVKKEYKKMRK